MWRIRLWYGTSAGHNESGNVKCSMCHASYQARVILWRQDNSITILIKIKIRLRLTFPLSKNSRGCCSFRRRVFTLKQQDVIFLVVPTLRVLPVDVKAIKVSVPQVRYGAVDEGLPGVSRRGYILELLRAERPTTCDYKEKTAELIFIAFLLDLFDSKKHSAHNTIHESKLAKYINL